MPDPKRVEDYDSVDEWADAVLEEHREEPPPDPGTRWYRRDLPRVFNVLDGAVHIGTIVLALLGLVAVVVAFNSG